MHGIFALAKNTEFMNLEWGRVGALCSPARTQAKQLLILDARFDPGKGHNFHMHPNQEEVILVISGQMEQWIETEKQILGPGDSVFIPPGVVHASFNVGGTGASLIAMFSPSIGDNGFETTEVAMDEPWKNLRKNS